MDNVEAVVANIYYSRKEYLTMIDNQFTLAQCRYPGCPKTVRVRPVFLCPPRGWVWIEAGDLPYKVGLYCEKHAEEIEPLL
jgi:hypothetical protein